MPYQGKEIVQNELGSIDLRYFAATGCTSAGSRLRLGPADGWVGSLTEALAVAVDGSGNVYTTGYFYRAPSTSTRVPAYLT